MKALIEAVLMVVSLFLLLPTALLFAQALVAFRRIDRAPALAAARPRMAVLIPAHDEASGIAATLQSVLPQLTNGDRCVVVADNCTDETASVARREGAEAVERSDDALRGKSYALDFGLRAIEADPPEVLVIVDADCIVAPECLDRIGRLALATQRPVQALYLMKSPPDAKRSTRIAEFAWRVKNLGRPLGYLRMGLPCQLMGSGMAFPWASLRSMDVATGHLTEDLMLGMDLARRGTPPLFCPHALVTSVFPTNPTGERTQRTRWEHGHLSMIVNDVPALLFDALRRRSVSQFALTLDLAVPPLALLVMVVSVVFGIAAVCAVSGLATSPLLAMATVGLLLAGAVMLFWIRFGADVVTTGTLAWAVWYAVRKIPLYLAFVVSRQVNWVKSKRDAE